MDMISYYENCLIGDEGLGIFGGGILGDLGIFGVLGMFGGNGMVNVID